MTLEKALAEGTRALLSGEVRAKDGTPILARDDAPVKLHKRTGVPLLVEDWTEQDWMDLHNAMQRAIRKIAKRHRQPKS